MRILYILPTLGVGGAEKLLSEIIPFIHQREKNIKIQLLVLTKKNDIFSSGMLKQGVSVAFLTEKQSVRNPINILKLRKFIIAGQFDLVHVHLFPVQYWVILALLGVKKKPFLFFTEHSTSNSRRKFSFLRPIERFIYRRYNYVISISEQVEKELLVWLKWQRNNQKNTTFKIIANGINLEKVKTAVPYINSQLHQLIYENIRTICMVGRFVPAKDQATLIRACTYLEDDIHLLLVGDGETLNANKELVQKLGLFGRVHFLGVRTDVERILKSVDLIVLSSLWEGFGIAAVEGLAAEKPVIVSDVGGLREVVNDKELTFSVGDYEQLSLIVKKLLTDDKFYLEKARMAGKRSEAFSLQHTVMEHMKAYYKVISK